MLAVHAPSRLRIHEMNKLLPVLLITLAAACIDTPQEPDDFPDVPAGVNVTFFVDGDGIAPDTLYLLALVGEWNGVDTLFYSLSEGERVIEENWFLDDNVWLPLAYDPLDELELLWRAWMAGDTAELIWTP